MNTTIYLLATAIPMLAVLHGCSGGGSDDSDLEAVKNLIGIHYNNAVNGSDAEGYAGLFMNDVMWAPPGEAVVRSTAEIQRIMRERFNKMKFNVSITPAEAEVLGDTAYVIVNAEGTVKPLNGDPESSVRVTGMFILKKQAGGWKIFRQIYNNKG